MGALLPLNSIFKKTAAGVMDFSWLAVEGGADKSVRFGFKCYTGKVHPAAREKERWKYHEAHVI